MPRQWHSLGRKPSRNVCLVFLGLLLVVVPWTLRAETLLVVDAGFAELEGYSPGGGTSAVVQPEAELVPVVEWIREQSGGIEAVSRDFLSRLLSTVSGMERVELAGASLNRKNVDPEQILLWMCTVRHLTRTFDGLQARPELHFEFYLINPANQFIAFKQSVTVGLNKVEVAALTAEDRDLMVAALDHALRAEVGVVDRFAAACANYRRRGAAQIRYAVPVEAIRFSPRLEASLQAVAAAEGRSAEAVLADARLIAASELNTIYATEGLMLPILPPAAMQLLRQGKVSGQALWMRFNCDAVFLNDLPAGGVDYDRSSDLIMISAALPVPDFWIGGELDYYEDLEKARRRTVPPAVYPLGEMTLRVVKRLPDASEALPIAQLSASANPRYGGRTAPDVRLRGFSAALRALYRDHPSSTDDSL